MHLLAQAASRREVLDKPSGKAERSTTLEMIGGGYARHDRKGTLEMTGGEDTLKTEKVKKGLFLR